MADAKLHTRPMRMVLADPTGQIERECADKSLKKRDVALTYALAIRDEDLVPVDWKRANAAIRSRWPKGLDSLKASAWRMIRSAQVAAVAAQPESAE